MNSRSERAHWLDRWYYWYVPIFSGIGCVVVLYASLPIDSITGWDILGGFIVGSLLCWWVFILTDRTELAHYIGWRSLFAVLVKHQLQNANKVVYEQVPTLSPGEYRRGVKLFLKRLDGEKFLTCRKTRPPFGYVPEDVLLRYLATHFQIYVWDKGEDFIKVYFLADTAPLPQPFY